MPDQPVITSSALPPAQQPGAVKASPAVPVKPIEPQSETQIPESQIIAKPLRQPNFIGIRPKNPNLSGYWGNRAVGEKESGLRYDQLISMGFRPAKPDELIMMNGQDVPNSLIHEARVIYGDLIFLVIPRTEYVGALKWNAESAVRRVRKLGQYQKTGVDDVKSEESRRQPNSAVDGVIHGKAAQEGKVAVYIPNLAETDSRTADNTGPFNLAEK
jgi:hypothetical protein